MTIGAIPRYQLIDDRHDVGFYRAGYAGEVRFVDAELGPQSCPHGVVGRWWSEPGQVDAVAQQVQPGRWHPQPSKHLEVLGVLHQLGVREARRHPLEAIDDGFKPGMDAATTEAYVKKLTAAHAVMVAAMKCKQTTDLSNAEALMTKLKEFECKYI